MTIGPAAIAETESGLAIAARRIALEIEDGLEAVVEHAAARTAGHPRDEIGIRARQRANPVEAEAEEAIRVVLARRA
ncbi:MAG: hypothetical protein IT190_09305, partial [Microbacteriaceae bacterium]|nr:hypothetical protein [Microbacteriaceae bacterium]